jgi:UPF0716 protein FxsA
VLGRLFLLFTVVPLVELVVLIRIGQWLGALPTIALVAVTGMVGAWLARREGSRSWRAVRRELTEGRVPGEELLHTLLIVVAGAFLVTPGVFTDVAGLLALVRPTRQLAVKALRKRLARGLEEGTVRMFWAGSAGPGATDPGDDGDHAGDGWYRRPSPGEDEAERPDERPEGRVIDV